MQMPPADEHISNDAALQVVASLRSVSHSVAEAPAIAEAMVAARLVTSRFAF